MSPSRDSPHKSCSFPKKVIKGNLDEFGSEFMANNAESNLGGNSCGFQLPVFLPWTK